ncbi:helix-turn-helix domain-containing protein [Thermovibrio sp.]
MLDKGVSIASIAKILGRHYNTVYSYVKRRGLVKKKEKTS